MFGVPNLGLDNRGFILMTEGRKNEDFARGLGIGSMYLRELDRDFSIAFQGRDVKVISVYETQDSPSVEVSTEFFLFFPSSFFPSPPSPPPFFFWLLQLTVRHIRRRVNDGLEQAP